MNSLFRACSVAICSRNGDFLVRSSWCRISALAWKTSPKQAGLRTVCLESKFTPISFRYYSTRKRGTKSRVQAIDAKVVAEEDKDAFFVVRKGDIVGFFRTLTECQAQVGSSVPASSAPFLSRPILFLGVGLPLSSVLKLRLVERSTIALSFYASFWEDEDEFSTMNSSGNPMPSLPFALNVVPSGIRVRLPNLPKKKNVHRDLKLAFKGFPGILNISPAVIGNKKTRDPVCKGYGFVDFKSQDDANRFIKAFSGQSISFGKIQKEITCEISNSKSPNPQIAPPRMKSVALPRLPDAGEELVSDSGTDDRVIISEDASDSEGEESPDDNELETVSETLTSSLENSVSDSIEATSEIITVDSLPSKKQETEKKKPVDKRKALKSSLENSVSDSIETTTEIAVDSLPSKKHETEKKKPVGKRKVLTSSAENSVIDSIDEAKTEITMDSLPSKKQETDPVRKKKPVDKSKATKGPKVSIPGSANRLKVKEKAMLTEVFSKYAMKSASTLKRGS